MQHQLEDLSRYKFGLALPGRWVFRDKDKDYGVDGEVEIFNSEEKATGLVFWVQLKATSSKIERTIRGIDLSLETIRYYKRLDIPVLIARYSEFEDAFYVKWASDIDPFYAKKNAKTMRVSFSESDIWNDDTSNSIEKYLSKLRAVNSGAIRLPIAFSLKFDNKIIRGTSSNVLRTKIRSNLKDYQNVLRLENDQDSVVAEVRIGKKSLNIGILGVAGCTFHSVDLMDKTTLSLDLIKDISLGISLALTQLGYSDLAARIVFSDDIHKHLEKKPEIIKHLLPHLLKTSFFEETLELVSNVCDKEDSNLLEIIAHSSVLLLSDSKNDKKTKAIEGFLKRNAERYKDIEPELYGISLYNLGNFYRGIDRLKDGIKCYLLARRYEPKYYDQEYFFGELAGALFDYGKYRNSANFYKKAIDFSGEKEWRPQYADALMFSGEYQKALDQFEEYINNTKDQTAEWYLKSICLSSMIETYKIRSQTRKPNNAITYADTSACEKSKQEGNLQKALQLDLLCGLAWYNLGQIKFKQGEIEDTSFCFTVCSLVQRWDIEAWVNATLSSFNNIIHIDIFALIVRAAYFCNGDDYIEALYELIERQNGEEAVAQVAIIVEKLISIDKNENSKIELRALGEDGKFKDIIESQNA